MFTQEEVDFKNNLYLASLKYLSKFSNVELNRMILLHDCIANKEIKHCVYFILDKGRCLIKIGKTNNLSQRFVQIKRAYRFCGLDFNENLDLRYICWCLSGSQASYFESLFHEKFSKYHFDLEWYYYDKKKFITLLNSILNQNKILYSMDNFQYVITTNELWNNDSLYQVFTCDINNLIGFDKIMAISRSNIEFVVNVYNTVLWTIFAGYYEYIKYYNNSDMFGDFWTNAIYYWYYQSILCPKNIFKFLLLNHDSKAIKKIKTVKPNYNINKTQFINNLNNVVSVWKNNNLYFYTLADGGIKKVNLKECFKSFIKDGQT